MRALLAAILLLPTAAAFETGAGLPFDVQQCARPRVPGGYAEPLGGCAWRVHPPDRAGPLNETITLVDGPIVAVPGGANGTTFRLGAPALDVRLVELRHQGFVLDGRANLSGLSVRWGGVVLALPNATIDGATLLGTRADPDVAFVPMELPARRGGVKLLAEGHSLGAATQEDDLVGRTHEQAEPMRVAGNLTLYATPDAGAAPVVALLESARHEVLLEGYTMTSPDVAAALLDALDRGAAVRVLLEGGPVGGVPSEERGLLATLAARGAQVRLLQSAGDFPARYQTLHAKTIVVDRERALVATENLHETSYPGVASESGTRGYGLIVQNASLARRLAAIFDADDAPWPDVQPIPEDWTPMPERPRAGATGGPMLALAGAWNVTPIVSPETSLALADALRNATREIDVEMLFAQPTWGNASDPFLDAIVDAARRNVTVRLLLDGHVQGEENAQVAARLDALAARERLPLEARVDASGRTLHAKMVVLDERAAYVGSMNWGRASALKNREVGLLVESSQAAGWLREHFARDWDAPPPAPPARSVPFGPLAVLSLVLASRAWRRS